MSGPWRETAVEYGFNAIAAIPLTHEGTIYGVLCVYADRDDAFEEPELSIVGHLGEIVGHAIAAAERKRALMSDEVIELEFQSRDVFKRFDGVDRLAGPVSLEYAVPLGNSDFLVYGTAPQATADTLDKLVETIPYWESVTVRSPGHPTRFELRMSDPPALTTAVDVGGYVDRAVIEDGDLQLRLHVSPSADLDRISDAVQESYPGAQLVRRTQRTRSPDDPDRLRRHAVKRLTDRQAATLDAAYHAGFFDWPREAAGEELADRMGVAPSTFHQHLRKAQRKILASVFEATERDQFK